eukprot:XP_025002111.1 zinc finger CCCH domain-containing protein 11A-like isoform X1 [Gallus gallus]
MLSSKHPFGVQEGAVRSELSISLCLGGQSSIFLLSGGMWAYWAILLLPAGACEINTRYVVVGTEPARPWSGAGYGGKRKACAEADTSGLPAKRSLAERQGRSAQCGTAPKREIGAEANGSIYVKVVLQVHSERSCQQAAAQAPHQAGGLPRRAGPSTGGRPSPAACPRSVSNTLAGCKRKGLEEEEPTAAQLPTNKRVRGQSGDSVLAPAAHPGPAAARSSKQRARRRRQKERRVELKKAALRAAAARAEASAVNSLVEMMQKLQLKD